MAFWLIVPVAFSGFTVATPLYTATEFGWRERELGWLFAVVGLTAAAVQGYIFGRLAHRFSDRSLLIAGSVGMAGAIAIFPFLPSNPTLYGATFVLAFANSIAAPAASGLVSRFAAVSEQGTMLGAAQAVSALGRLVGPLAVGQVYDVAGPRPAYLAAGALMLLAGAASLRVASPETISPGVP
jgi:MFS family permease